jgi:hypothetical protein
MFNQTMTNEYLKIQAEFIKNTSLIIDDLAKQNLTMPEIKLVLREWLDISLSYEVITQ